MDDVDTSARETPSLYSPTSLDDPATRSLYKNPLNLLTSFPSNPAPPHPTAFLSPFKSGSTSVVYHTILKKPEIISFDINGEFHSNANDVAHQFLAELRLYRAIGKHRNIVGFLGSVEGLGMILEYVEGLTLYDALKVRPEPSRGIKIEWFNQLIDALSHIHGKGLSHGDLSLLNVYVAGSTIKLLDFGRSVDVRNFPTARRYGFKSKVEDSDDEVDEAMDVDERTATPFDDEDHPPPQHLQGRRGPASALSRWIGGPERVVDRSDWVGYGGRGRHVARPPSLERAGRTPTASIERSKRTPTHSMERTSRTSSVERRRPPSTERSHRMPFLPLLSPSSPSTLPPLVERALGDHSRGRAGGARSQFADRSPLVPKTERGQSERAPPPYHEKNASGPLSPRPGGARGVSFNDRPPPSPRYKYSSSSSSSRHSPSSTPPQSHQPWPISHSHSHSSSHHSSHTQYHSPHAQHRHSKPKPKKPPIETIHPGTRPFAAPEILRDECEDPILADAYSFGIMVVCIDLGHLIDLDVRAQREEKPGLLDEFKTTIFTTHIQAYTAPVEYRSRIRVEDKMDIS